MGAGKRNKSKHKLKRKSSFYHVISPKSLLTSILVGIIISILLMAQYWIFGGFQPIVTSLLAGVFLGIFFEYFFKIVLAGFFFALSATIIYPLYFSFERLTRAASLANPKVFFGDVILQAYYIDFLFPLAKSSDPSRFSRPIFFILTFIIALGTGWFVFLISSWLKEDKDIDRLRKKFSLKNHRNLLSLFFSLLILLTFILVTYMVSGNFRLRNNEIVYPFKYATDYLIYKRTYQLMKQGVIFYKALDIATDQDARGLERSPFWHGPKWIRHPLLFQIWKVVGKDDANRIFIISLLLASFAVFLFGLWTEKHFFAGSSIILTWTLFPYFFATCTWENLYCTDLWMTLFGLIAFASFVNGWHLMTSVAACLSLLSKFHGIYLSGIFFLAYIYIFLREKRWQPLVVFLLLLGLTLIWYQVHWTTVEKRYPEILTEDPSKTGSEFMIGWGGSSRIISRLNWMCNFVGDIYTHFEFYASVFVPLGLLGFMLPLLDRRLRQTLHLPLLIGIAWSIGFCLLIGMLEWSCQYWGVQIMPVALLGFTLGCLTLIYALEGNRFQEPLIKG